QAPLDTLGTIDQVVSARTPQGQVLLRVDAFRAACELYPNRLIQWGEQAYLLHESGSDYVGTVPVAAQHTPGVPLFAYSASLAEDAKGLPERSLRLGGGEPIGVMRRRLNVR